MNCHMRNNSIMDYLSFPKILAKNFIKPTCEHRLRLDMNIFNRFNCLYSNYHHRVKGMITATQLRNAKGLKSNESILQFLSSLDNPDNLSHNRGRQKILEPEFFQQYLRSSRKNPIGDVRNKVLSVANNKGGVGKTSVTALIAYKTANMGFKTVVIDSDPQANLTNYILGEGFESQYTLYDILKGECTIKEALVKVNDYLYILPSGLDNEFIHEAVSAVALPRAIKSQVIDKTEADLFLIDTNPSLSDMNLAIHSIADIVLTIINNDSSSVKGLKHVLSKLDLLGYTGNVKAIFNKIDGREKLDQAISRISPLFENHIFSVSEKFIRVDREIKNAQYNKNGAESHINIDAKCQTDSLAVALEILSDLSSDERVVQ